MIATGSNGKPSFTKADNGTIKHIMTEMGKSGPRAVILYLALVKLANERRDSKSQPRIENLNYQFLESIFYVNQRTMKRLIPELERIGIIKHHPGGPFSPFAITILKGYWPNGSEPDTTPRDTPTKNSDIPDRIRPAYEALMATGKMPNLTANVLQQVDGSHPKARILEDYQPIADQLEALTGSVFDPLKWLLKQASGLEQVNTQGSHVRRPKSENTDKARAAAIIQILKSQGVMIELPGDGREALRHELGDTDFNLPNPDSVSSPYVQAARMMKKRAPANNIEWFTKYLNAVRECEYVRIHGPSPADE